MWVDCCLYSVDIATLLSSNNLLVFFLIVCGIYHIHIHLFEGTAKKLGHTTIQVVRNIYAFLFWSSYSDIQDGLSISGLLGFLNVITQAPADRYSLFVSNLVWKASQRNNWNKCQEFIRLREQRNFCCGASQTHIHAFFDSWHVGVKLM